MRVFASTVYAHTEFIDVLKEWVKDSLPFFTDDPVEHIPEDGPEDDLSDAIGCLQVVHDGQNAPFAVPFYAFSYGYERALRRLTRERVAVKAACIDVLRSKNFRVCSVCDSCVSVEKKAKFNSDGLTQYDCPVCKMAGYMTLLDEDEKGKIRNLEDRLRKAESDLENTYRPINWVVGGWYKG